MMSRFIVEIGAEREEEHLFMKMEERLERKIKDFQSYFDFGRERTALRHCCSIIRQMLTSEN